MYHPKHAHYNKEHTKHPLNLVPQHESSSYSNQSTEQSPRIEIPNQQPQHINVKLLEFGHIYFFYKPKVMQEHVNNLDQVQKLLMVLKPDQSQGELKNRVIIIPKKTLPKQGEKRLAIVSQVDSSIDSIVNESLSEEHYETFTRGDRVIHSSRPLAFGLYELIEHNQNHTHLSYVIEFPKFLENESPNKIQTQFGIEHAGTMVVSVKNPQTNLNYSKGQSTSNLYNPREDISIHGKEEEIKKIFGERKFHSANPPSLLSIEEMQLLLIGTTLDSNDRTVQQWSLELEQEAHEEVDSYMIDSKEDEDEMGVEVIEKELNLPQDTLMDSLTKGKFV
ncbi:predicted protein [Naegleria gruberi]|uniref:Predicted protein n=1 Tax=Naegleria gruberi TaxID=5762 RepID=D2VUC8_NAEGR|nr:uncharacterized protein NAEGRDRAFT_52320 [Naegleria gruberi]EFC39670.1 predicted protein [Naegleria gruberi]|eukprot:XP_002672414.1 predicted protein [Naegleria gruberi strain NEG-M]